MKRLILVACKGQGRQTAFPCVDAKLLVQFPDQCFFGSFVSLHISAGKLPQARHLFALGALGKKNTPFDVDQGDGRDQN